MTPKPCDSVVSCGIRTPFGILSPCEGQVTHALLTRPPLEQIPSIPKNFRYLSPLDLHVLGTPPAFVLSQDQTLTFNPFIFSSVLHRLARNSLELLSSLIACVLSSSTSQSVSFSRFGALEGACLSYQISTTLSTPFCSFFRLFS